MTTVTDLMPLTGTLGGGFFIGLVAGYAIKKIIKIAAVIVGLFIAALTDQIESFIANLVNSPEPEADRGRKSSG